MNDVQLLFVVLALLYGWECLLWVRRGHVACFTWLGKRWHLAHPSAVLGNHRGGFLLAPILPPLGTVLTAANFPLSLSPDGALAFVAASVNPRGRPAQGGQCVTFTDLREARASGKKLLINGAPWLTLPTNTAATTLAENLTRLAALKPSERLLELQSIIRRRFDRHALEQRWQAFRPHTRHLRLMTNAVFGLIFVAAPALVWTRGLTAMWLPLLIGMFTLTFVTAFFFRRAHAQLYPRAEDERFTHTCIIALSPVTAIRALDPLARPLCEAFHPLTVGQFFLPAEAFREYARPVVLDLRHPALPLYSGNNPAGAAIEAAARTLMREAAERFLRAEDCDPDELCRPAPRSEAAHTAYCPRCGVQFTSQATRCEDCGGLALVDFESSSAEKSSGSPPAGKPPG